MERLWGRQRSYMEAAARAFPVAKTTLLTNFGRSALQAKIPAPQSPPKSVDESTQGRKWGSRKVSPPG